MQIHLTVPITVHTAKKRKLELLPVIQDIPRPSDDANLLGRFLKPGGTQVPIVQGQSALIQSYMLRNKTEALSEDGIVALTLLDDMFVEWLPEVGMTPTEAQLGWGTAPAQTDTNQSHAGPPSWAPCMTLTKSECK